MKNKFLLLLRYLNRFSVFRGINTFVSLNILSKQYVTLKHYPKIFLRKNTSDIDVFNQVLVNLEYNINEEINPKIIIDAGANIGLTSLFFSNKYPGAKIIAIEPEKDNFKFLVKNCSTLKNIIPINKAVWSDNNPVHFKKSQSKDSHFISNEDNDADLVETITIPDILSNYRIDRIDILKLDIEGAEKEIFSKNVDLWLPKVKCLIIELHDRFLPGCSKNVFNAFSKYDFNTKIKGELLIFIVDQ